MDPKPKLKLKKGFAVISRERRIEIARMGGRTISRNRKHMSRIGREGGQRSGERRQQRIIAKLRKTLLVKPARGAKAK